ncbi:Sorting nexin Mvp1 [Rhodotorula toruloides ATCC 204091]|uniref:Sorting nexin MVP1 n=1 Tax=Rhodotorula toruloides TaxID=5286 RepID=A0A0K3CR68_RHOTO|nr:Sorting nexin Mvp1 [Rhodotorula toruloides ATCC 204091]KAK4333747.1 Sorting nexin MVP1 [Rhodotorula toruloides]PRQ69752.1 sorting nexin Mvp1 [Rhodotorula toruloides]
MASYERPRTYSYSSYSNGWGTQDTPPLSTTVPPPLGQTSSPSQLDYSVIDAADGAGASGVESNGPSGLGGNILGGREGDEAWQLPAQSRVQLALKGDMEGSLFAKHHVWLVIQPERGTSVERRYSDFVYLLDALTKRYPFRLLPSLPPKRIQLQGRYLAADDLFLERRRKGLERALTALTSHPVIKHDGLLATFLNEQTDLTLYRKAHPFDLSEESHTRTLSPSDLSKLPTDLDSRLALLRQRITPLVEHWTRITTTLDRLAHRRLNQSKEYEAFRESLEAAVRVEREQGSEAYKPREVEQTEREVLATARVVGEVGETEGASARRKLETVVEEVKRHREIYVNLRDLFTRQTTLGIDNVDKLRKRVETNASKLSILRTATPRPLTFDADAERLTSLIDSDQRSIDQLLRRRDFVRWCVWEEVGWAFRCTSLLSLALKGYAADETAYAKRLAEQWGALAEALGPTQL